MRSVRHHRAGAEVRAVGRLTAVLVAGAVTGFLASLFRHRDGFPRLGTEH